MAHPTAQLAFDGLELAVHLGCEPEERALPQPVEVALRLAFAKPPEACRSDRLDDTVCYAEAVARIRSAASGAEFATLEHLAERIRSGLREWVPDGVGLRLRVTKLRPPVPGLRRGVSFTLEDPGTLGR
jgi:dihydroneopterin aldolase